MSLNRKLTAFSPNAEYFAYSSPDSSLKIWETSSGILKQEYIPTAHLSTTCSSLRWGPAKLNPHLPKSPKKFRSVAANGFEQLLIAMGTLTGDIMVYSFTNAELYTSLRNGHTASVNDICWYAATGSLFTCANDLHIIVWDLTSGKILTKWKADKVPIHSLCVIDDENLLSASTSVQWWNFKQKTVIKTFTSHATEVLHLKSLSYASNTYFLSSAASDRVINAWQLNGSDTERAVASFVSIGEPTDIDIDAQKDKPLKMSVVTKDGLLHLFEHSLNGRTKKALHPKFTIHIGSKSRDPLSKPKPVPVLAANVSDGFDSCLLVYGTLLKPSFERINVLENSSDLYLIRDTLSSSASIQDSVSKVKQTEKPDNIKVLAPGHMTDSAMLKGSAKKRKQKIVDQQKLSVEQCLDALNLKKEEPEPAVRVDSMVHLLLQGLQSKDNEMLNTVLQNGTENIIHNTLQRLPISTIFLVLQELHTRLQKQEPRNNACLRWLSHLLSIHLPYLMSCKDVDEYLVPISQLIEARVENFSKMSQLRGCLKVLLSQDINSIQSVEENTLSKPLVEYKSESSSESDEETADIDSSMLEETAAEPMVAEESKSSSDLESDEG